MDPPSRQWTPPRVSGSVLPPRVTVEDPVLAVGVFGVVSLDIVPGLVSEQHTSREGDVTSRTPSVQERLRPHPTDPRTETVTSTESRVEGSSSRRTPFRHSRVPRNETETEDLTRDSGLSNYGDT